MHLAQPRKTEGEKATWYPFILTIAFVVLIFLLAGWARQQVPMCYAHTYSGSPDTAGVLLLLLEGLSPQLV